MKLLENYGIIKNDNRCILELREKVDGFTHFTDEEIIRYCNESAKRINECLYFSLDFTKVSKVNNSLPLKLVNLGIRNKLGDYLYARFRYSGGSWNGAFIDTKINLCLIQNKNIKAKTSTSEDFFNLLHSKLMIPNTWTSSGLENYISLCIARINTCLAKGKDISKFIIFNNNHTFALINSGLLDKFGKYIMLCIKMNDVEQGEAPFLSTSLIKLSGSKVSLIKDGFIKSDLTKTLERVAFSDNGILDLLFTASIDDFDLDSRVRLDHCICERRFRFPEALAGVSNEVIYSDIVKAIQIGVELNKYDRNYIKPIYNKTRDCIDFVIPYHISNDFQKKPELGIVVSYLNDYWQIMTVLSYEDVMKDIKLFNMYENETF